MSDELTDEWLLSIGGLSYQSYDGDSHVYFTDDTRTVDVYTDQDLLCVSILGAKTITAQMRSVKTQADFLRVCELFRFELPKPQEATT